MYIYIYICMYIYIDSRLLTVKEWGLGFLRWRAFASDAEIGEIEPSSYRDWGCKALGVGV